MSLIVTVLRSGGDYRPEHAARLHAQCRKWGAGADFVCLSDVPVPGVPRLPLREDWPGWWAKMEAFGLIGPCLYLDLDTTVRGSLAGLLRLAAEHEFVTLRDFNPGTREMGSGVMGWRGDLRWVLARFAADPDAHMAANASPRWWGDQGFLERHGPPRVYWQDLAPGAVVSHKKHCANGVPPGAKVVAFHGKPRPWEVGQ